MQATFLLRRFHSRGDQINFISQLDHGGNYDDKRVWHKLLISLRCLITVSFLHTELISNRTVRRW